MPETRDRTRPGIRPGVGRPRRLVHGERVLGRRAPGRHGAASAHGGAARRRARSGKCLLFWERDFDRAEAAFRRSNELNPNYTQGRVWHGLFSLQWVRGIQDEGVAEVKAAYDNDPLSAYGASLYALALGCAGRTAEALPFARLGSERDPDAMLGYWVLGLVTSYTLGGFIHILLVVAIIMFLVRVIQGRNPVA